MQPQYTTPTCTIDSRLFTHYGAIIGPHGIALYCALVAFAGADHQCQSSLRAITSVTGMSRRKAIYEIAKLVDLGLIVVIRQEDAITGQYHPNRYVIPPLPPLSEQDASQFHNRDLVLTKNDGRCVYCGDPADTIDHVIPRSKGGTDDLDNLVPACRDCNSRKGNRLDWSPE